MSSASKRLSRLLAVTLLAVLVALCGSAALSIYAAYAENRDAISVRRDTVGRLQAIAAQSDAVDRWAADLTRSISDGAFLSGTSAALTAADLQARLAAVAAESGAMLTSFRALEPQQVEGLVDITVEMDLQGNLASIHTTLERIESSVPLLFIDEAQFRANQGGGLEGQSETMLDVHLMVHGVMQPESMSLPGELARHDVPSPAL
jgi:Type II secretion system (T2SS), protein M subtype b